jgi:transposase
MIQVTPQMRVLAAVEPADFRQGIDGLARLCRAHLKADPFSGAVFVFRNRQRTAVKALVYDGQGFWLCHKRLSSGRFRWWPSAADGPAAALRAHELAVLLSGGDAAAAGAVPDWRNVTPGEGERK